MTVPAPVIAKVKLALNPLINVQLDVLRLPRKALEGFEPSQVGTIVGTLVDACVPALDQLYPNLAGLGLTKAPGLLGDREGYPDFEHSTNTRLELKMLYVDPVGVTMKTPPTPREASARITQKVTIKNVIPDRDLLFLLAYQLRPLPGDPDRFSPTFIDLGLFSMIECVASRDARLLKGGGRWFGNYETPAVISAAGRAKLKAKTPLTPEYGRKESEGKDYNEDTNFGKLARVPFPPLQKFLQTHGYR